MNLRLIFSLKLPSLDSALTHDRQTEVIRTGKETVDECGISSAKKMKSVDLEDRFDDVFVLRRDRYFRIRSCRGRGHYLS